jgi:hypothetical protein
MSLLLSWEAAGLLSSNGGATKLRSQRGERVRVQPQIKHTYTRLRLRPSSGLVHGVLDKKKGGEKQ